MSVGLGLGLVFVLLFRLSILCLTACSELRKVLFLALFLSFFVCV